MNPYSNPNSYPNSKRQGRRKQIESGGRGTFWLRVSKKSVTEPFKWEILKFQTLL